METNQLEALTIQKDNILFQFSGIKITDKASLTRASESLSIIRGHLRRVESVRVSLTKPSNDLIRTINAAFKRITAPLVSLDKQTTSEMESYHQVENQKRAEEQEELNKQAQARLNSKSLIPEAIAPLVPQMEKSVQTEVGKVTFIPKRKWRISNYNEVPREFLKLDEVKIESAVKAGIPSIPGVEIYMGEITQVRGA